MSPSDSSSAADDDSLLKNISNSAAFIELDALLDQDRIQPSQAERCKFEYTKLHDAVLSVFSNERKLLERGKVVKAELNEQNEKLEQRVRITHTSSFSVPHIHSLLFSTLQLQDQQTEELELKRLDEQRLAAEERVTALLQRKGQLVTDLQRLVEQRRSNEQQLSEQHTRTLSALNPLISSLDHRIRALDDERQHLSEQRQKEVIAGTEYTNRIDSVQRSITAIEKQKLE